MSLPAGPAALPVSRACLVVLDGWGLAPPGPGNAVELADTPHFDELRASYPYTQLQAGGRAVGLPEGQMGNSEVGHLNLGAGAVIEQDLTRIDDAVAAGELASNGVLRELFGSAPRVHLIGLASDGGVHSGWGHLRALIELGSALGVEEVIVHAFTDGRDTLPTAGAEYAEALEGWCAAAGNARIGSVVGRYYAMDRDSRWERTQLAYDLLVHGRAPHHAETGPAAVRAAYAREETDEFVAPTLVGAGAAIRPERDAVLAFNFRPDRMRQITRALAEPGFGEVDRSGAAPLARYATMTEYREGWPYPVAFPPVRPEATLAEVLAGRGLTQLHVAETEKYAHVTYFFNGGREAAWPAEDRRLVPSPAVATYDLQPEMSASGVTDALVEAIASDHYDFIVANYANPDMVGHTGVWDATIRAVETVDACLDRVLAAVEALEARDAAGPGALLAITADHGNADRMRDESGAPVTAHSLNEVPIVLHGRTVAGRGMRDGVLADVAPTLLELAGLPRWEGMTGLSLLEGERPADGPPARERAGGGRVLRSAAEPPGGSPA